MLPPFSAAWAVVERAAPQPTPCCSYIAVRRQEDSIRPTSPRHLNIPAVSRRADGAPVAISRAAPAPDGRRTPKEPGRVAIWGAPVAG
ncbi:hypothetical protein GCM10009731_66730 [Streptomyces globosus]